MQFSTELLIISYNRAGDRSTSQLNPSRRSAIMIIINLDINLF